MLARRESLPVPALSLGVLATREEAGRSVLAGISLPLPLFDRGQGRIARATAELARQRLELEAEGHETCAAIERAVAMLQGRLESLSHFEREVGLKLPTLRAMAEQSYRDGKSTILDLLDALRSLKELRLMHVDQLLAVRLAAAELIAAAGPAALD